MESNISKADNWGWARGLPPRTTCLVLLLLFCIAQALFAVYLNGKFYRQWGPFYDSLSYYDTVEMAMTETKANGPIAGIKKSLNTSTVILPWLLVSVLGLVFEPSRAIGTWIQSVWVFAMLASLWTYFRVCLKASPWLALVLSLPFASVHAIYYYNGGLGDFRMDLHLYLLFGCCVAWLYIALETGKLGSWALCGVFIALCCLARATSPVYLSITMLAILVGHLLEKGLPALRPIIIGGLIMSLTAAVLAGWFFIYKYEYLYYYYVVWNVDAQANLPLAESYRHINFALGSTGPLILWSSLAAAALLSWPAIRETTPGKLLTFWKSPRFWKLAPFVAPVGFLVFKGAGLNLFVSMPGAFGLIFFILSFPGDLQKPRRWMRYTAGALLLTSCLLSAYEGRRHYRPAEDIGSSMSGFRRIIGALVSDTQAQKLNKAQIGAGSVSAFSNYSIQNILVFDYGFRSVRGGVAKDGLVISITKSMDFTPVAAVEWKDDFGDLTPEEIIPRLVEVANRGIDYMVLPDDSTLEFLETRRKHYYINNYSRTFRDTLLKTGRWEAITGPVPISRWESFQLYANRGPRPEGSGNPAP